MRGLAVADCETDPFLFGRVPIPFAWGYYDGTHYERFWGEDSTRAFVKFLRKQPVVCFAHNGGRFDWHFLLRWAEPYTRLMIINGRIAALPFGLAELRDSFSILPVPLKAYKKDEIDYTIMERKRRDKPANRRKIESYLRNDCVYLHELIAGFVEKFGLRITQASAAMHEWVSMSERKAPITDVEFYDRFAPYYYGGRVECFEYGVINTRFAVYDINSAYPFAMLYAHPYSSDFDIVKRYVKGADFYRVRCVSRGAFPFRGEGDPQEYAGLRFPADDKVREYTITGWEFDAAQDTHTIERVKVLESITFSEHVAFREYIMRFYEMRLQAKAAKNEAESLFAKLLMNSLYGKFAANPENYRQYIIVPMDVVPVLSEYGYTFAGEFGPWGLAEAPLPEAQRRFYNVATGASITGFVRAMLWRAICSSKGILYCDTDSVAVRKRGARIVLGEQLGEWKHEGDFNKAGIAGKKLYVFRGVKRGEYKYASKGAKLTLAQLWQVARGVKVTWRSDAPTFSVNKAPSFIERDIHYTARRKG